MEVFLSATHAPAWPEPKYWIRHLRTLQPHLAADTMFERPLTTFVLSLFMVIGGTILLYRPGRSPQVSLRSQELTPPPEPTPAQDWAGERDPLAPTAVSTPVAVARSRDSSQTVRFASTNRSLEPPVQVATHPRKPVRPYTRVAAGETLGDVALRVYGSPAFQQKLWWSNRDQVRDARAPLEVGSILRTPEISE